MRKLSKKQKEKLAKESAAKSRAANVEKKREERFELIFSLSWMALDASWMLTLKTLCYVFIGPTLLAGLLLILVSKSAPLKITNFGIWCWSSMNILWMCSEFFEMKSLLYSAYACLTIACCLIFYMAATKPEVRKHLVRRMNFLRNFARA